MAKSSGGKLRVFFAEFEGDDETMQDGLRAIGIAVQKTFQTQQPPVRYLVAPGRDNPGLDNAIPGSATEVVELEPAGETLDEVGESRPARSAARVKKAFPTLAVVKNLNLRPPEKQAFRDFYAEKRPKTQFDQIVVALYYLQKTLELQNITPEHIYTCYQDINASPPADLPKIKIPNDLPQVIRNCANRKRWVSGDSSSLMLTQPGETAVVHNLPPRD